MRKALILLLLASLAFAEFQLQNMDVSVSINEDGSAQVEERINLIIFSQYSMQLYESGFNRNTLSDWQSITGQSEIKTHISSKTCNIDNLIIRPQPSRKSPSGLDVWYAQIIMTYSVHPFYEKDGSMINNTGIVTMEKYKPRTVRYKMNENAFNLPRTETGDIKLDEETLLSITPPANAMITGLNPITRELSESKPPFKSTLLSWSGLTLVQFSLEYEIEQSLDKEVMQFFSDLQNSIKAGLTSAEGVALVVIAVILVLAYFYLRFSRR